MSARPARFVVPVLVLMAALVPAASAATKEKTVKAEVVFENGQRAGDPGDCSAVVFVKWADVPGTTRATAKYIYRDNEASETAEPPFDDTLKLVADYQVPAGHHWISVGASWSNGPVANTCEDTTEKQKLVYGTEASVELTVEIDPKVCKSAKTKLTARRKAVNKLNSRLRKATTKKAKKALRAKIAKAKAQRTKAGKRVSEVC